MAVDRHVHIQERWPGIDTDFVAVHRRQHWVGHTREAGHGLAGIPYGCCLRKENSHHGEEVLVRYHHHGEWETRLAHTWTAHNQIQSHGQTMSAASKIVPVLRCLH
jgi:hypothetical protein